MSAPDKSNVTGLLLAGGRGQRMEGADKGLLPLDGDPLALHVLRRLRPQVAGLMISANRNTDIYCQWAPVVADDLPGQRGPLAGVLAGLSNCPTEWMAVAPCDLPALPDDVVARLIAGRSEALAAYAAPADRGHSLVCLLHRSLAPSLAAALAADQPRVARWFSNVGACAVRFDNAAAFANLNTPDELAAAQANHG